VRHAALDVEAAMSKLIYRNLDALAPVEKALAEADAGLGDPSRTIETSGMSEVLGAAAGAAGGGAIGFAALYFAGTAGLSAVGITSGLAAAGALVGGGMAAGVFVLAAPVAILGVAGFGIVARRNARRLAERKDLLLQQAIRKRDAILSRLKTEADSNAERLDYLKALNVTLQGIIKDLKEDLHGAT
jgi:hypothetical protein